MWLKKSMPREEKAEVTVIRGVSSYQELNEARADFYYFLQTYYSSGLQRKRDSPD